MQQAEEVAAPSLLLELLQEEAVEQKASSAQKMVAEVEAGSAYQTAQTAWPTARLEEVAVEAEQENGLGLVC